MSKYIVVLAASFALSGTANAMNNNNNTLEFSYDNSGNQLVRNKPGGGLPYFSAKVTKDAEQGKSINLSAQTIDHLFSVTQIRESDEVRLHWSPKVKQNLTHIEVISLNNGKKTIFRNANNEHLKVDISTYDPGVYFVHFHLKDLNVSMVKRQILKQ